MQVHKTKVEVWRCHPYYTLIVQIPDVNILVVAGKMKQPPCHHYASFPNTSLAVRPKHSIKWSSHNNNNTHEGYQTRFSFFL